MMTLYFDSSHVTLISRCFISAITDFMFFIIVLEMLKHSFVVFVSSLIVHKTLIWLRSCTIVWCWKKMCNVDDKRITVKIVVYVLMNRMWERKTSRLDFEWKCRSLYNYIRCCWFNINSRYKCLLLDWQNEHCC
jgi:hypothetical protein